MNSAGENRITAFCASLGNGRAVYIAKLAIVAAIYFGLAKLGLTLAFENSSVSAFWPPTGFALAAMILCGYRVWPAIAVAAFAANATTDVSLATAMGIAAGNTLEALLGGYLLAGMHFRPSLERMRDVVVLAVFAAGISTMVSATIGVFSLVVGAGLSADAIGETWRIWWLGDAAGDLLVAPVFLLLAAGRLPRLSKARVAEAAALGLLLAAGGLIVFNRPDGLPFLVFPLLIVAALRFSQLGAAFGGLLVSIIAVWMTSSGHGIFANVNPDRALLSAQVFAAVAGLTALLAAAIRSERKETAEALELAATNEHKLEEAQKLAHLGSWEWEVRSNEVRWSREMYRIFGRDPSLPGPDFEEYIAAVHPDDRERVQAAIKAALEQGASYQFRHRIVRPDGQARTLACRGEITRDEDGRPLAMTGTGLDVTSAQHAEARFEAMLESAPDGIVIADQEGTIVLVNSQTEKLFGYDRDELVGQQLEVLVPDRFQGVHPHHRGRYALDPTARPMGSRLELKARRKDGSEFPVEISLSPLETEEGLLISSAIRDATERKQFQLQLEHQALHDPLTGLPNRTLFLDRLEQALTRAKRTAGKLAVLFCDLDDFKFVNDSLGHESGDRLLNALTPRLRKALRPADTVARFGGDEFVILCEDLRSEEDASRIAQRIGSAFTEPLKLDNREHFVSVSTGIVIVEAGRASAAEVLRDADAALYRAKESGRGRFEIFDAHLRTELINRLRTESELRQALTGDEMRLDYQPVVTLADRAPVAVEALVRWQHPLRGLLSPAHFIETAELSGLIAPLGRWVLQQACNQAALWTPTPGAAPFGVSVNLSPKQIARADLVPTIADALEHSGLDPSRLELELTENILIADSDIALQRLNALKSLGVRLVLDDFGTGYSSLGYLKRYPLDALKIDRSFVAGLGDDAEDSAIVTAVLRMAEALGITCIAEGVETEDQAEMLSDLGCELAQGYLFSRPVSPEQIATMLGDRVGPAIVPRAMTA